MSRCAQRFAQPFVVRKLLWLHFCFNSGLHGRSMSLYVFLVVLAFHSSIPFSPFFFSGYVLLARLTCLQSRCPTALSENKRRSDAFVEEEFSAEARGRTSLALLLVRYRCWNIGNGVSGAELGFLQNVHGSLAKVSIKVTPKKDIQ